jgi:hypothetical protein
MIEYLSMIMYEEFENTKGVIRIRKSIYKTPHRKQNDRETRTSLKLEVDSGAPEVLAVPAPLVILVVLLLNNTNII